MDKPTPLFYNRFGVPDAALKSLFSAKTPVPLTAPGIETLCNVCQSVSIAKLNCFAMFIQPFGSRNSTALQCSFNQLNPEIKLL
jgi:hypothetical protein